MLLALAACENPPILSSVADRLGADLVAAAEIPVRTAVAIGSLASETCGVADVAGHAFAGGGATALRVTTAVASTGSAGEHAWTFAGAGIEEEGTLVITADADRQTFAYAWEGTASALAGTFRYEACEAAAEGDTGADGGLDSGLDSGLSEGRAVVSGGGTWSGAGASSVAFLGAAPDPGVGWSPPGGALPTEGWVRWTESRTEETLTLSDAGDISGGRWPGTARGENWSAAVSLPVP